MSGILVTGAGGLVGGKVVRQLLATEGGPIYAIYHRPPLGALDTTGRLRTHIVDLADPGEVVLSALKGRSTGIAKIIAAAEPTLVLHAAAMTNVDACERERSLAYAVNVRGTAAIAHACAAVGSRLVYVSTDYVFDGSEEHPGPYREEAPVHPIGYYGLTKLQGEEAVQEQCAGRTSWAICRTAVVYGYTPGTRSNFALWTLGELRAGRTIRVVTDQFNTPTLADHLAEMLITIGQRGGEGIYHTAGADCLDRLSFAQELAAAFGLDASLLQPTTTAALQQVAPRPLRSGLLCRRIERELGIYPISTLKGVALLHHQIAM